MAITEKLRIFGADDLYISLLGNLWPVASFADTREEKAGLVKVNFNDGLAGALIRLRPSDCASKEKIEAKIDEALANLDEYIQAMTLLSHGQVLPKQNVRNTLESLKEHIGDIQRGAHEWLRRKKIKPVSDAELSAFENTINHSPLCPESLKVLANARRINFIGAHDLLEILPPRAGKADIFFAEPGSCFAGARLGIATMRDFPESLAEYFMDTLYRLIAPNLEQDETKLLNDKGQAAMEELRRHPKLMRYSNGRQVNTTSAMGALKCMHYWLNDPRNGHQAEQVRADFPKCAALYDAFMAMANAKAMAIKPSMATADRHAFKFEIVAANPARDQRIAELYHKNFDHVPEEIRNYLQLRGYRLEISGETASDVTIAEKKRVINIAVGGLPDPAGSAGWQYDVLRLTFGAMLKLLGDEPPRITADEWGNALKETMGLIIGGSPNPVTAARDPKLLMASALAYVHRSKDRDAGNYIKEKAPKTLEIYRRCLGIFAEKNAELNDALKSQSVSLSVAPRIIQDPKYGAGVTQQDINTFVAGYEQWDDWVKEAVKANNLTFVIGRDQPIAGKDRMYDPDRKEVELDIRETNKQDFRQDNQSVAMCSALLCLMHNKMPPNLDWEQAEADMLRAAGSQGIHAGYLSQTSILGSAHRTILQGNKDILSKQCPHTLKLYEIFMDAARKEFAAQAEIETGARVIGEEPRILVNPDRFGEVSEENISKFKSAIEAWPKKYRTLMARRGVTFLLIDNLTADQINAIEKKHPKYILANPKILDAGVYISPERSLFHQALYKALGGDLPPLNWDKARQIINREFSAKYTEPVRAWLTQPGHEYYLLATIEAMSKDGIQPCPTELSRLLQDYMAYADQAQENSVPQTARSRIIPNHPSSKDRQEATKFQKIYNSWPPEVRAILEREGITFRITRNKNTQTASEPDSKTVIINMTHLANPRAADGTITMFNTLTTFLTPAPSGIDWDKAADQLQQLWREKKIKPNMRDVQGVGLQKPMPVHILEEAHLAIKSGDIDRISEGLRTIPAVYEAYDRYMRFVREKAIQQAAGYAQPEKNGGLISLPPQELHLLTDSQYQYGQAINGLIKTLGVSAQEFDEHFRCGLITEILGSVGVIPGLHMAQLGRSLPPDTQKAWVKHVEETAPLMPSISGKKKVKHISADNPVQPVCVALMDETIQRIAALMCPAFKIDLPKEFPHWDNELRNSFKSYAPKYHAEAFNKPCIPNLLQSAFDSGRLHLLSHAAPAHKYTGFTITMPTADKFFTRAIEKTARDFARLKGISDEQLAPQLQALNKAAESAFLSEAQLAEQKRREEQSAELARLKDAQDAIRAREKLARQQAEAEAEKRCQQAAEEAAKKPVAYDTKNLVAQISHQDPNLANEIARLSARIDCRVEMQKELGNALFTGAMLKLFTAVATGQKGQIDAALDPRKNTNITSGIDNALTAVKNAMTTVGSIHTTNRRLPLAQRKQLRELGEAIRDSKIIITCLTRDSERMLDRNWQQREEEGYDGQSQAARQ